MFLEKKKKMQTIINVIKTQHEQGLRQGRVGLPKASSNGFKLSTSVYLPPYVMYTIYHILDFG